MYLYFQFYIGGVPNKQEGLVVVQNFTGCIENLFFNATNIIKELRESDYDDVNWRYHTVHTSYSCPQPLIVPVTFTTASSYSRLKGYEGRNSLNVSLSFRTYEPNGLILHHDFLNPGYIKVIFISL